MGQCTRDNTVQIPELVAVVSPVYYLLPRQTTIPLYGKVRSGAKQRDFSLNPGKGKKARSLGSVSPTNSAKKGINVANVSKSIEALSDWDRRFKAKGQKRIAALKLLQYCHASGSEGVSHRRD